MLDPETNSAVVYLETCHRHPFATQVFQSTSGASPEGCVDRTLNVDLVFMLPGDCKFWRVGKDWALPCFPLHIYGVQPAALRAITRLHRCPLGVILPLPGRFRTRAPPGCRGRNAEFDRRLPSREFSGLDLHMPC